MRSPSRKRELAVRKRTSWKRWSPSSSGTRAAASTAVDRNDINLNLNTECNVVRNGVPNGIGGTVDNVCDPTGGFRFTQDSINNFGRINIRRGHRIVEFALKYYF